MNSKDKRKVQYNDYMDNYSWCNRSNSIVREHKRNMNIFEGVNKIIGFEGMYNILHHMRKLNKYHKHISLGMFSSLSIIKRYKLKQIQLQVLYNHMLFNSYIK